MREEQFEIRLHNGPFTFSSTFVHGYSAAYQEAVKIAAQHYHSMKNDPGFSLFDYVTIHGEDCQQRGAAIRMGTFAKFDR